MVEQSEWELLMEQQWTIPSGTEKYLCLRKTVGETMYIKAFRAVAPTGTHHTVLTAGTPSGNDGVQECNGLTNENAMIYGSGIGTDALELPQGVATKVEAGQQLLLNLHLYNVSDQPITATTGIEIIPAEPVEVEHVAEGILAGRTFGLVVPQGTSTQIGYCTMNGDVNILAIAPHMHQAGRHMKVYAELPGGDMLLHDDAYDFNDQQIYRKDTPVPLTQGTRVRIECSYDNTTGAAISFGDSSDNEMCFAGLIRYPAFGGSFGTPACDDG